MTRIEVFGGISVTRASKSAIVPSAHLENEPNSNVIRFLDENRISLPDSDVLESSRELWRFFPVIVIVSTSVAKNDGARKRLEPNRSVTDLTNTRNVCQPMDAAKAWLINLNSPETFEFGEVKGCLSTMEIHRNGRPVTLTSKEFKTLVYLIKNPRRVISRDELLNEVWG
jgi:Transcriptional regulatory protein, C terminal